MVFSLILLAGGLLLLVGGAHGLVQGSSALALRFNISPLVVGLTVVAFGTSSPELLVSLSAASIGEGHLAVGNVVGSNIANIALILGTAALVTPLRIKMQVVKIDLPIMIGCTFLLLLLLADGALSRGNGAVLFFLMITYVSASYLMARHQKVSAEQPVIASSKPWGLAAILTLGGLVVLILGAHIMVSGAVELAEQLRISTAFVGLTVVAIGTSLPELATSLIAAFQHKADMAIGNVLGSNIFNMLGILGPASLFYPIPDVAVGWPSLWVMAALAVLSLPLLKSEFILSRREGLLLLAVYIGYIAYLLLTLPSL